MKIKIKIKTQLKSKEMRLQGRSQKRPGVALPQEMQYDCVRRKSSMSWSSK
jgi:hypothetical protein